jgi:hypothetical protein
MNPQMMRIITILKTTLSASKAGLQVGKLIVTAALDYLIDSKPIRDVWSELIKYVENIGYKEPIM